MTASSEIPATPSPLPRTSLIAAPGSAAIDSTVVEDQVARELLNRLVGESPRAEIAHFVLIGVVAVLLWPWVAHVTLGSWAAIVVVCTAIRGALRARVVPGSVTRDVAHQTLAFRVTDGSASYPVVYRGIAPDTFNDSVEVVVEGRMQHDGVIHATDVLAKCGSRYESVPKA